MAFALAAAFAAFHLECDQLRTAELLHDLGFDFGAVEQRGADREVRAFALGQNFVKRDLRADFAFNAFDGNDVLFLDFQLFAAGFDYCVQVLFSGLRLYV